MSQDQFSMPGLFTHPTTSPVAGPSTGPDLPIRLREPGRPNQPLWITCPEAGPSTRPADDPFWLGESRGKPYRLNQPSRIQSPVASPSTRPDLPLRLREPGPMPGRSIPSHSGRPPQILLSSPTLKPYTRVRKLYSSPPPLRVPVKSSNKLSPSLPLHALLRREVFSPIGPKRTPPPPPKPKTPPPKPPVLSPASLARLPEFPARVLRYRALLPKYEPVIPRPKPIPRRPIGPLLSPPKGGFPKLQGARRASSPKIPEKVKKPEPSLHSMIFTPPFDEPYDFTSSSSEDDFVPYDAISKFRLRPPALQEYMKELKKWEARRKATPRLFVREQTKFRHIPPPPTPPTPLPPAPLSPARSPTLEELRRKMIETDGNLKIRILFSDEAHFWLNGYVNKQNCRIWSEANPQVCVKTPLHPEKLTVCCALWAGGIIGPYFFKNDEDHNVTVNGDRYTAMIANFFIPELNNHDVQKLWFQQDGATCHTARATIDLLKDTFGDRLISRFGPVNWPPRSCDLTPLDYFLWGYVKSLVYADKPQTLDHLEDNIRRVIADIRPQMLEKVIENWTSR
ncbi:putative DD41D transposase [Trichonephila clavipes]|uniref:Putative DD41D transposase n=1 Tax=Trichonephila clavipes TaxID=2585209 RepID=A0A8X6RZL6_TRICX|nr:putative DD41D transposase [Trichonephila clavipes]